MNLEVLILKILEHKNNSDIDETQIDLKRICTPGFGSNQADMGYVAYLYKHYNNEIQVIKNMQVSIGNNIINRQISNVEDIRNYLIKIAIIKICNKESIQYEIKRMNDIDYCMRLLN